MYRNKAPIDILTLITFYKIMAFCKKSEGKVVLIELISQIPNLVYLEEYLRLVKINLLDVR
jgi:replicative DNA helicase